MTSNHDSEPEGDASLCATYAGAKRRIAVLETQLQEIREAGTKKKT